MGHLCHGLLHSGKRPRGWGKLTARVALRNLEKVLVSVEQNEHTCAALAACRGRHEELREDVCWMDMLCQAGRPPEYVPWESLKDTSFIKVKRNMPGRGALTPKNSVLAFLWRPELMLRE